MRTLWRRGWGWGERHLRRLFRQHLGAAPVSVAQTRRVLLAKQLIHESDLSMAEVAMASGFGSVRRFNETFQALYGRPPSELRRRKAEGEGGGPVKLGLAYRPPYDWERDDVGPDGAGRPGRGGGRRGLAAQAAGGDGRDGRRGFRAVGGLRARRRSRRGWTS